MLTGFATLSQTAAAVVEAARRAGKAVGVAKVSGEGDGNVAPWNGGLSYPIGGSSAGGGGSRWDWTDDDSNRW